ncbi:MAG: OmpH family outer membrane protein [Parasulfuritortus sp.]|jgi:outer membrane protein|nr:OmpH family outer membrane protein [Parasulfuritortus sp.]
MRKVIFAVFLGLLFASQFASAEMKIGYIDTERLFRDSSMAARAQKKLEVEFAKRDQDLQKMIKQARDLQNMLEKEDLTLSDSEKAKKERDLANMTREVQRAQREFREDLNQRKQEEFNAIHERARSLILDIANKEKFDLILETAVYASPRIDLTDRVLKALEQR